MLKEGGTEGGREGRTGVVAQGSHDLYEIGKALLYRETERM